MGSGLTDSACFTRMRGAFKIEENGVKYGLQRGSEKVYSIY